MDPPGQATDEGPERSLFQWHVPGPRTGERLVLLHGFTQNSQCWGSFAHHLGAQFDVRALDLPGHGNSGFDQARLWQAGELAVNAGGNGVFVGYSLGARVALHGALQRPDHVRALVLIGVHPGMRVPAERDLRVQADARLASRLRHGDLGDFLRQWLTNPLFSGLTEENTFLEERLQNRADGLAASLEHCGTGTQEPLWDRLAELNMPVLLMTGERDPKFTALASEMARLMGANVEVARIPEAGHALHLEQPQRAADRVSAFVADVGES